MTDALGIYVHVPFCAGAKCPYCDFYSVPFEEGMASRYLEAFESKARAFAPRAAGRAADSIYFGGGTPSVLGAGLARQLAVIKANFAVSPDAEITFEANPAAVPVKTLELLREEGFNRVSIGMQSSSERELGMLGRRHTAEDTAECVKAVRSAGFENISLDLMLCTPGQTVGSLRESIRFAMSLGPEHISAYLLKPEPGTKFYDMREELRLPDGDMQAEYYEEACRLLEQAGYAQYEISNFARGGRESRHNLKYWNCDDYIGFGPSAHSLFEGRRFYCIKTTGCASGTKKALALQRIKNSF